MERILQNFGPIRTFESTFLDHKISANALENSRFRFSTDLNFLGKVTLVELSWDLEQNSVPTFGIDPSKQKLISILDGLFNFWSQYGLKQLINAENGELESFLREKNHIPVIEKADFHVLTELRYGFQLMLESLFSELLLHTVSSEQLSFESARHLEKLFNSRLNAVSETSIHLLDQNQTECFYRFTPLLDEGTWKELWVQVIQKLANQLKHNNARQWVDKPWQ